MNTKAKIFWCVVIMPALLAMALAVGHLSTAVAQTGSDDVFVRLVAPLDEPRGLCLDIPGHRDRVDVKRPLGVHTCKWDIWNLDERFSAGALNNGELRMPEYRLCAGVQTAHTSARVVLLFCNGNVDRAWQFDRGRLRLDADPSLCLTAGAEPSQLTPGGRRLPSRHVARSVALEPCHTNATDRQTWTAVSPQR